MKRAMLLCVALAAPVPAAAATDYAALASALVDAVVVPGYERHARATRALAAAAADLCADPDASSLDGAHGAFHDAMDAWQEVSIFGFGPLNDLVGRARFQFWPDRRGTGARQLRKVLRTEDRTLLEPGALAGKSVALGDLQALERVLFSDTDALLVEGSYRCALAAAIAAHQASAAEALVREWTAPGGFREAVRSAAGGNDAYFDARGPALDLYRSIVFGLQTIAEAKLARPLGDSIEAARPKRAESWRSARSTRNVVLNLETVIILLEAPGGFADALRNGQGNGHGGALADGLVGGLRDAQASLAALREPLAEAVTQPAPRAVVEGARADIESILALVRDSVSVELGLDVGFNESDGDG